MDNIICNDALHWAINGLEAAMVYIVRYALSCEPEVRLGMENEWVETGLVIDAVRRSGGHRRHRFSGPRGMAIIQIFVMNLAYGTVEELPMEQHIP